MTPHVGSKETNTTRVRLHALDGLRGFAAIVVLMYHCGLPARINVFKGGYLAVDLFFVISGCVIAHVYDEKVENMGVKAFIGHRIIRFYPLYAVGLLFGFLLYTIYTLHGKDVHYTMPDLVVFALVPNMLFLPIFNVGGIFDMGGRFEPYMDSPAWSLMFELLINAVYAATFRHVTNLVLVAFTAASGAVVTYLSLTHGGLHTTSEAWFMWIGLARVCFSFSLGMLIYRKRHALPRLGRLAPLLPLAVLLSCMSSPSSVRDSLVVLIVAPLVVVVALDADRVVLPGLSLFLGAISYGLYIIHEPLFLMMTAISGRFGIDRTLLRTGAAPCVIGLAWFLNRYYDPPARRLLTRLLSR